MKQLMMGAVMATLLVGVAFPVVADHEQSCKTKTFFCVKYYYETTCWWDDRDSEWECDRVRRSYTDVCSEKTCTTIQHAAATEFEERVNAIEDKYETGEGIQQNVGGAGCVPGQPCYGRR